MRKSLFTTMIAGFVLILAVSANSTCITGDCGEGGIVVGVGVGVDIKSENKAESSANSSSFSAANNSVEIGGKRSFHQPTEVKYPGYIADTTPDNNGPNFAPLHRMFRYKMANQNLSEGRSVSFTYEEILMAVENIPDYWWNFFGDVVKKNITRYGKGKEKTSSTITITVPLDREVEGEILREGILKFRDMGYAHVSADHSEQVTWNVLGLLLKDLMENGYDYVILAAEGVNQVTWSKSLGLGFNVNSASISDDESKSKAGGGGTGVSYAEAGKDKYPTLQMNFGLLVLQ